MPADLLKKEVLFPIFLSNFLRAGNASMGPLAAGRVVRGSRTARQLAEESITLEENTCGAVSCPL